MTKRFALAGADIFDGSHRRRGDVLVVENGRIAAICAMTDLAAGTRVKNLNGGLLAPGFIDLQVNGGGGVMLNDAPSVASIRTIADSHARFGTTSLLPTLITDRPDITAATLAAGRDASAEGVAGFLGIHLEGPFLSPARKGAHDPSLIRPIAASDLDMLKTAGLPHLLLTVAAETVPPDMLRRLVDMGIVVSIGHSNADFETARAAFAAGARGVTHLFNAMSPLGHRAPGVVGAALESGDVWCGIIADGHHVHPAVIATAVRSKRGPGRIMLVTDAMATAGAECNEFHLMGRQVRRNAGRLTLDDGTLAGSDLTMIEAVRFAVFHVGLALEEALRMASLYPAAFLGIADRYGVLAPGSRADIVHLTDSLDIAAVWRSGTTIGA
jgi:N-acetylglucosamine-6-phosphate deacetylase